MTNTLSFIFNKMHCYYIENNKIKLILSRSFYLIMLTNIHTLNYGLKIKQLMYPIKMHFMDKLENEYIFIIF